MREPQAFKLSICITTRNRAALIGATLETIVSQATNDCEIVIVDGASTDGTTQVVSQYACRFPHFTYIRQETNNGLDRGFNEAVEHARGEYFWLMPDDDFMKPGAIARVLEALKRDYSLVVVNVEYRNFQMSTVLQAGHLPFVADREFAPSEFDQLFATCWRLVRYGGAIVMKRELWLARKREPYFGSYWMVIAVVFQERLPGAALVLANPLISVRIGNQSWQSKLFKIMYINWPSLVRSLPVSVSAKEDAWEDKASMRTAILLTVRAAGEYSLDDYRRHMRPHLHSITDRLSAALIAMLPRVLLNSCLVLYYSTLGSKRGLGGMGPLLILTESPFYLLRRRGRANGEADLL